ncbi:kinetoplastid-specific phosphatase, putative [Bodo saltans]|uniref:Kinetoplastid-specific phosphatase, putative n=1 Tax=Bodo saltans TaxID=75058 RepID=A0A0S4KJG1_BODSA|nr:kinetoplastid-specific phosphatase, putative [Bodo saltans]|eukprot:CUI14421.1 kinetoplastid-specific phosphatase, putative [Bodo saltans]
MVRHRPDLNVISSFLIVVCIAWSCVASRRLVAVGDLHGDLNQTLSILRLTGLIDDRKHWIGGNTILVQVGDVLDVGPNDIDIVKLFMKLGRQASAAGGSVEQLLGNHEIRNLRGDFTAVNDDLLAAEGGAEGRRHLLSMSTPVGQYLRTRNAIFHHGRFLFMHGGFSSSTVSLITSLDNIPVFNDAVRNALTSGSPTSQMGKEGLNLNETDEDAVKNPILVRSLLNVKCGELHRVLETHFKSITTVVVGHVPHDADDFDHWNLCDGALVDIDFGMSTWKKGEPGAVAALQIYEDNDTMVLVRNEHVVLPRWLPDFEEVRVGFENAPFPVKLISVAAFSLLCFLVGVSIASRIQARRDARVEEEPTPQQYGTF